MGLSKVRGSSKPAKHGLMVFKASHTELLELELTQKPPLCGIVDAHAKRVVVRAC